MSTSQASPGKLGDIKYAIFDMDGLLSACLTTFQLNNPKLSHISVSFCPACIVVMSDFADWLVPSNSEVGLLIPDTHQHEKLY